MWVKPEIEQAGGQGFEPRYYGPEPHVLPLDDPPVINWSIGMLTDICDLWTARIYELQTACQAELSPNDCYLVNRIKKASPITRADDRPATIRFRADTV